MVDNKSLSYQAYPITPIMSNEETVQGIIFDSAAKKSTADLLRDMQKSLEDAGYTVHPPKKQ